MPVTDEELRGALEGWLGRPVTALRRAPLAYRSSFPVDEVVVEAGGCAGALRLVFKDVSPGAGAAAKPAFVLDPAREIAVYRDVLAPLRLDAPRLVGCVADGARDRFWLVMELVDGEPLAELGDPSAWESAARWLAALHARRVAEPPAALLRYDRAWFEGWLARARALAPHGALERVARGHERVVERLLAWPVAFVHGEFYASNVLVARDPPGRLVALDWEMAGMGPGLLDLAALTAGGWSAGERERLALAYHSAWRERGGRESADALLDTLECARLQTALQWIGWSADWTPPAEHAQDWVAEAQRCARRLGL